MNPDRVRHALVKLLWAALLLAPLTLRAAGPTQPDTGTILQQMKPTPTPAVPAGTPGLRLESQPAQNLPTGTPFAVNTIRISGNTLFDTTTLHALVAANEGRNMDLSQLYQLAARITDYYHGHGYPLARAVIPAQTIHDGTVNIEVIEARYGRISLDNHSRVNDSLLQETLSPLDSGAFISQELIDNTLLRLSDLPGVEVDATLKPGETVGTSDLTVQATSPHALTGSLSLDNYGNRYTGRLRGGGTVFLLDPLHHGDVLSASALSSGGGLAYGRIGYEIGFNGYGSRVGSSFTAVHYALGGNLQPLDAHGIAYVWNVWVRHPFIRSPGVNLYGQVEYDHKRLHDRVGSGGLRNDRFVNDMVMSLTANINDSFLSGGVNSFRINATFGHLHFNDAVAIVNDAATADILGGFSKWSFNYSRLQTLTQSDSLYVEAGAQLTNGNLDSAEKLTLGGPYTVRAYDMAAASGDSGYMATVELRHDFGNTAYGRWQALAFFDGAHIKVNQKPWASGSNSATLSGAGGEIDWSGPHNLSASLVVATPLGSVPAIVGSTSSVRAWFDISKRF